MEEEIPIWIMSEHCTGFCKQFKLYCGPEEPRNICHWFGIHVKITRDKYIILNSINLQFDYIQFNIDFYIF